ncbi:MAG: hypothetical protein R2813_04405 [Flavobacteriales bacterium]
MYKKNKTLSAIGLVAAITVSVWWDKPWNGFESAPKFILFVVHVAAMSAATVLLVQSLRDGTYGK